MDAARESGNPNLNAIIFRQQFTQMTDIVEKTHRLYTPMGATYVGQPSLDVDLSIRCQGPTGLHFNRSTAIMWRRVCPSSNSIAMKVRPSASSIS